MTNHITIKVPVEWEHLRYEGVGRQPTSQFSWHNYYITKYPMCMYVLICRTSDFSQKYETLPEAQKAAIDHFIASINGERL